MSDSQAKSISEYIQSFPETIQRRMESIRKQVNQLAPQATEKISWGMPTFTIHGNLIHFAGHTNHIGIYPGPLAIIHFEGELEGYKTSKGAIQLPNNQELPMDLLEQIILFCLEEQLKDPGNH